MKFIPLLVILICFILPVVISIWYKINSPFRFIIASYTYFTIIVFLLILILNPLIFFANNLLPQLTYQRDLKVFDYLNYIFSLSFEHAYLIVLLIPFVSTKLVKKYS